LILRISNRPRLSTRHHSSFCDLGASEFSCAQAPISNAPGALITRHLPLPARNISHLLHLFLQSYPILLLYSTNGVSRTGTKGIIAMAFYFVLGIWLLECGSKPRSVTWLYTGFIYTVYIYLYCTKRKRIIYHSTLLYPSFLLITRDIHKTNRRVLGYFTSWERDTSNQVYLVSDNLLSIQFFSFSQVTIYLILIRLDYVI
jgi:hypothetical protein